jgi:hypothetical protein
MKIVAVLNGNQPFFNETEEDYLDKQEPEQEVKRYNFKINPYLIEPHNLQLHQSSHNENNNNNPHNNNHHNFKERDNKFLHLQSLIDQKKHFLLKNHQKIKKINKQNEFLENVKSDYSHYNQYIVKQKSDQMKALELLNQYIKDLTESGELSEQNIKDSKHEQRKILKEIKFIKHSLDELIDVEKIEPSQQKINQNIN